MARLRREVMRLEEELALGDPPSAPAPPGAAEVFALLDQYPAGFLSIHGANGDYVYASPSVTPMFGWQPAELIGTSAYDYFHDDDLARIASSHASHSDAAGDRIDTVRYRLRRADGSYRWVETISRARLDGDRVEHIVCVTRDVDREERARERAAAAEDELVRAYHQSFAQRLANALTHELANPLTGALGGARLLRSGDAGAIDQLDRSLERIRGVVRELTLLAGASSSVDVVDIPAVVRRVVELADIAAHRPELELEPARTTASPASVYHLVYSMLQLHTRELPLDGARGVTVGCRAADDGVVIEMRSGTGELDAHARADLLAALRGTAPRSPDVPLRLARTICEEDLRGEFTAHMDSGMLETSALIRSRI